MNSRWSEAWLDRNEGWATGLRLAVLALRAGVTIPEEPAVGGKLAHDVMSFLVSEVLQNQPPAMRSHLLRSSVVDQFCPSLCEALQDACSDDDTVVEAVSAESFVTWLRESELFVIPVDPEHGWFRYHDLFRDMLREEALRTFGAEVVAALRGCAGAWLEDQELNTSKVRAGSRLSRASVTRCVPPCVVFLSGAGTAAGPACGRAQPARMLSMMRSPNCDVLARVAPSICRSRSYVTYF